MDSQVTTAREDRRCIELTLSGQPCRNRPAAERDRCYIHGLFRALNDGRSTIDIPLLEDPQAILYVYSQVARALAQGAIPPANANGIIRCCKGAERLLEEQRKREQFEERKRNLGNRSQESKSMEPAGALLNEDQQDQTHATVPRNLRITRNPGAPCLPKLETWVPSAPQPALSDSRTGLLPSKTWEPQPTSRNPGTSSVPCP